MTEEQIQFILDCMEPLVALGIINLIFLMIFLGLKIFQSFDSIYVDREVKEFNYKELYEDLTKQYNDLEERNIFLEKANRRNSGHLIDMEDHIDEINGAFDELYKQFISYRDGKIDISNLYYYFNLLDDVINVVDDFDEDFCEK